MKRTDISDSSTVCRLHGTFFFEEQRGIGKAGMKCPSLARLIIEDSPTVMLCLSCFVSRSHNISLFLALPTLEMLLICSWYVWWNLAAEPRSLKQSVPCAAAPPCQSFKDRQPTPTSRTFYRSSMTASRNSRRLWRWLVWYPKSMIASSKWSRCWNALRQGEQRWKILKDGNVTGGYRWQLWFFAKESHMQYSSQDEKGWAPKPEPETPNSVARNMTLEDRVQDLLVRISVEAAVQDPFVRDLHTSSLYNRSLSKISLSLSLSLSQISARDLLARLLQEIPMKGRCTRSLEEVSWQDLCKRSLYKLPLRGLKARSLKALYQRFL